MKKRFLTPILSLGFVILFHMVSSGVVPAQAIVNVEKPPATEGNKGIPAQQSTTNDPAGFLDPLSLSGKTDGRIPSTESHDIHESPAAEHAFDPPKVTIVGISASVSHTCAVTNNGDVMCWGSNTQGQLGDGSTTDSPIPVDVAGLSEPVASVSAGNSYTCAVTSSGSAKCWGSAYHGKLGTTIPGSYHTTPIDVEGLDSGVKEIQTSVDHTCAVKTNGEAMCWGNNLYGQLGDGTTTLRYTPVNVNGLSGPVASISLGSYYSCALLESGAVQCWGRNTYGQLGNGTITDSLSPVDVQNVSDVIEISSHSEHNCVLTDSGSVKCWGDAGQLGDGTVGMYLIPIDWPGLGSGVLSIKTGSSHNCALLEAGDIKCWGHNYWGQLGDGTNTESKTLVDVVLERDGNKAIALGVAHSCAITDVGGVVCWGLNDQGQLGDGTTINQNVPVPVMGTGWPKWTFMIYMDGDNDLEFYAILDFLEMAEMGGSNQFFNIVVQFDRWSEGVTDFEDWTSTKRFFITNGITPEPQNAIEDLGEVNMGDESELVEFLEWAMDNFPADIFVPILWNHGNGWQPNVIHPEQYQAILGDYDNDDALDMDELRNALSAVTNAGANPFEILGMDACLMASIETDAQIREYAKIRVGSQETEPLEGWPYGDIFSTLLSSPNMDPEELAEVIIDKAVEATPIVYTQSAVDLGPNYQTLIDAVDVFAEMLISQGDSYINNIQAARNASQYFDQVHPPPTYTYYIDLFDFAFLISENEEIGEGIRTAALAVIQAVGDPIMENDAIIYERHSGLHPGAHGISIYFPTEIDEYFLDYDGGRDFLNFTSETHWDEWLHYYLSLTAGTPDPFTKTTPTENSFSTTSPILHWSNSSGVVAYEYCLDIVDNGSCDTGWIPTGIATSAGLSGLTNNTTYYWQVRSKNAIGDTYADNGDWWSFTALPQSFTDVPTTHWAWPFVERLYAAGITNGCAVSPLRYCPDQATLRSEMAVFLLRGINGSTYTPPPGTGLVFVDVPITHWAVDWIEQLHTVGITNGCGGGNYCPENTVLRSEMAVFLLRTKYGSSYTPPAATGTVFGDVPASHWAAAWIEQLYAEGITSGCWGGNYCPENPVTRAEMAVFLVRTFELP